MCLLSLASVLSFRLSSVTLLNFYSLCSFEGDMEPNLSLSFSTTMTWGSEHQ